MRKQLLFSAVVFGVLTCQAGIAQTPAGTPAGSTGQCNDGTYTTVPSKRGACRGHQGVKAWFATAPATGTTSTSAAPASPAPATAPASTPAPAASAKTKPSPASTKAAAPGGAPNLVWLNTSTNVYHCYGTEYYGKTKAGKYVSEADAKTAGAHPEHGKACSQ